MAYTNTRKFNWDILTITEVFLDQKRVNVCKHMVKMAPCDRVFTYVYLLSSDRGRYLCLSKYLKLSFCLCVYLSSGDLFIFLQIKGEESENSYQELKRSPKNRHTQTLGNCIEIFRQARPSFSIFWFRKTAVPVKISRYSFRVFVCVCPLVISSIRGKSFNFPLP